MYLLFLSKNTLQSGGCSFCFSSISSPLLSVLRHFSLSVLRVSTWIWMDWIFCTDTECHRKYLHVTVYVEEIFKLLCIPDLYQCYS